MSIMYGLLQEFKYLHVMTPAGVKYGGMYDSCRSHVSQCMNSFRSPSMLVCMTPAGS